MTQSLPIDAVLPQLVTQLKDASSVILHAPTGAGKTTRVPPAVADSGAVDGAVWVIEPRRVAARAAAERMASERGTRVGQGVGLHIRFDRRESERSRIVVLTDGMLLRRLQADPFLDGVGAVVFDEVHERSLDADLGLAITRRLQADLRPELKLIAMSATLDLQRLRGWLVDAAEVHAEGRTHPVTVDYLQRPSSAPLAAQLAEHVPAVFARGEGHLLVFLPGVREIEAARAALQPRLPGVPLLPLHARLPPDAQRKALAPGRTRSIILATNVAETSVTIPNIDAVVDAGLVRTVTLDPRTGLDRRRTVLHSQASADQRAGRAGRTRPGRALRLWTERQHAARAAHDTPEILQADLTATLLRLRAWGEPDPRHFDWLDAPPDHAIDRAERLLRDLGAVDDTGLTQRGAKMAEFPIHPRLAAVLVDGASRGAPQTTSRAVALLSEFGALRRDAQPELPSDSDLLDQVDALDQPGAHGWRPGSRGALDAVRRLSDRLHQALGGGNDRGDARVSVRHALLAGFADRVAVRRSAGAERWKLATGRGAASSPWSAVKSATCVIALDVEDRDGADALLRMASALEPSWLQTTTEVEARYDAPRDRVIGQRVTRYRRLVLDRQEGCAVSPVDVERALFEAAAAHPERHRPKGDTWDRWVARLRFAADGAHDLDLDLSERALFAAVVPTLLAGQRSLACLKDADWVAAHAEQLPWSVRQRIDQLAPERLTVPSGSAVRVDYTGVGPPVLAVRIQEMFGCTQTPTLGERRVPVMLHLLAPNGRPQQVTDDLAGFWARTYDEVRKELRRRYPKHAWPDDPTQAAPERRPRRKR